MTIDEEAMRFLEEQIPHLADSAVKEAYLRTLAAGYNVLESEINISRVRNRVKMGGHPVPEDKIISHYYRCLDLLMDAVQSTNRAYIFDNSNHEHIWLAEITDGRTLEMKTTLMPVWFKKALWDKFNAAVQASV